MVQESTGNIHIECHGCCALQRVQEQTWSMFSRPLLKGHPKSYTPPTLAHPVIDQYLGPSCNTSVSGCV